MTQVDFNSEESFEMTVIVGGAERCSTLSKYNLLYHVKKLIFYHLRSRIPHLASRISHLAVYSIYFRLVLPLTTDTVNRIELDEGRRQQVPQIVSL